MDKETLEELGDTLTMLEKELIDQQGSVFKFSREDLERKHGDVLVIALQLHKLALDQQSELELKKEESEKKE